MSNRIFQAVWDNGPNARSEMIVLMVLADCADAETGTCFPSYKHIAHHARMGRATVHRVLIALEKEGWITCEPRVDSRGRTTSNLYTVSFEALGLQKVVRRSTARRNRGSQNETPPSHCETGEGLKMTPPVPSQNETPLTNHNEQERKQSQLFEKWLLLPLHKKPTFEEFKRQFPD